MTRIGSKVVGTAMLSLVTLLGWTVPVRAELQLCAKVDRNTGELREGSPIRLRVACKIRRDGAPVEISIGTTAGLGSTLGSLSCATGQVPKWDGVGWECDDDASAATECEQGEVLTGDGRCRNIEPVLCEVNPPRVFVTSQRFRGDLLAEAQTGFPDCAGVATGLDAADCICGSLARTAGLNGAFQAWLSTETASPSTRFLTHSSCPYVMTNGDVVADDWADLTDGTIQNSIRIDENGVSRAYGSDSDIDSRELVTTNTFADGTTQAADDCSDWAGPSGGGQVRGGDLDRAGGGWTYVSSVGMACDESRRLYCFEQ